MRPQVFLVLLCCVLAPAGSAAQDRVTQGSFAHAGQTRTYSLYVPPSARQSAAPPLLIALHGSGRDGASIVNPWKSIAEKEGIIVVGPDSRDKASWGFTDEGPDFFEALVRAIRSAHPVDPRRVYLFGHSAGAIQSIMIGLVESEYFAAVAVHAGALPEANWYVIDHADRKIPIAIWVGTADRYFPMPAVDATKTALESKGIPVKVQPIPNHDHNYYRRAHEINPQAWEFLKSHSLSADPKFKLYDLRKQARLLTPATALPERRLKSFLAGGYSMNRDEIEGRKDKVKGKAKQAAAHLTDDPVLHDEGVTDEAGGKVQEGFGRGRRKIGEALDDIADDLKR